MSHRTEESIEEEGEFTQKSRVGEADAHGGRGESIKGGLLAIIIRA